ncbi:hypothetical protein J7G17_001549 [Vibrio parahaemolyticus]|nr:hypothetical protein [Vibrio parahaemolyticus]EGU9323482.1 hypothetical protein [Vibrio parahaemolyticus]EHK2862868.1 hypothetical protein [Vibrio parahaemolyticus]EIO2934477.1 hypothetical protein [Vibrio parahaemolyticus]
MGLFIRIANLVLEKEFKNIMVLGQYAHWARLQEQTCKASLNWETPDSESIARLAHWLAALYVVIEGWKDFKIDDKRVNALLELYAENVDLLRRCRNAVYHCQKELFDPKIQKALQGKEMAMWAAVIQDEIECFIYMWPFFQYGVSQQSYKLHEEFIGCIGWQPNNTLSSWNETYLKCADYLSNNGRSELEKTNENDALIQDTLQKLIRIRNSLIQPLIESRRDDT